MAASDRVLFDLGPPKATKLSALVQDFMGTVSKLQGGRAGNLALSLYAANLRLYLPDYCLERPEDAAADMRARLAHLRPNSQANCAGTCFRFMKFAAEQGAVTPRDARRFRPPPRPMPAPPRVLSFDEIRRVHSAMTSRTHGGYWSPSRLSALVWVISHTGLRTSEVAKLTYTDLQDGRLRINKGGNGVDGVKSASGLRMVPVCRQIQEHLELLSQTFGPDAPLFGGEGWKTRAMLYQGKKYGLSDATCTAFRHTFATALIQGGLPPFAIRHWMGHSSLDVTARHYVNVTVKAEIPGFDLELFKEDARQRLHFLNV